MRVRALWALTAGAMLLAVAASQATAAPTRADARVTIDASGSSTALPLVADLAYFYRKAYDNAPRFALVGGGTASGIFDVARGATAMGLASRAKDASDPAGLVFTPIAYSGVCIVSNRENPVPNITRATVQEVISGRVTTWAQVPGSPRGDAMVAAGLAEGTGARTVVLTTFVDAGTPVAFTPRRFTTGSQQRAFVLSEPAGWSYVDVQYTRGLHVVPYEGIPCNRATIRSGQYPATRPLAIVTRGEPRGAVARFIKWTRTSAVARRVIATRYVPAR